MVFAFSLQACSEGVEVYSDSASGLSLDAELRQTIHSASGGVGNQWLILPESDNYDAIPQDVANPITSDKVALGKMLFHDTGLATSGHSAESKTWSCASCHHAAAGFKSGIPQGIGEGGTGFGLDGSQRRLAANFDPMAAADATDKPDIQPVTSPSILNTAYQDVMLWNGQFGNRSGGVINAGITQDILAPVDTPKQENSRALSGLETQAIAGLKVHRLNVESASMQSMSGYNTLLDAMPPAELWDMQLMAGKSIAAYERTVLANRAPFQDWLKGDVSAMSDAEKRGGVLFFGKAGCADCHRGPALSSEVNAGVNDVFMAVGFADFNPVNQPLVHGPIKTADKMGRGGFTQNPNDNYKFKIPQLYNLSDTNVFGHGASFSSIREVLEYKNRGVAQNRDSVVNLDTRFKPLGLTGAELDDLDDFLSGALYDAQLSRYQPQSVPSGDCVVVDPQTVQTFGMCP